MRKLKRMSLMVLFVLLTGQIFAQIQATTADGKKVTFNKENRTWEYVDSLLKKNNKKDLATTQKGKKNVAKFNPETFKSFSTSKGEISYADLKNNYLSHTPDDEIVSIVNEIYLTETTCNCVACHNPSECPNGMNCKYRTRIPCGWCCP